MDTKALTFIPKMYFPNSIFFGDKSSIYLKLLKEKIIIVVSEKFFKLNKNILHGLFGNQFVHFVHNGEPTPESLQLLKAVCRKKEITHIVAFGGGSIMDLAKIAKMDLRISLVVVPTTIGSGSEVSQYALLTENENKKIISSKELLPDTVIIDPKYLASLTKNQVFLQSIDALSHALESLVSRLDNYFSDRFALMAIDDLYSNLYTIGQKGLDNDSLKKLQFAAILAGIAQSSAGTGLTHALAHYFGPKNKIPHADAVATFLPDVLKLNIQKINKYDKLNRLQHINSKTLVQQIDELFSLFKTTARKIHYNDINVVIIAIRKDVCTLTNPYYPTVEDIKQLVFKHV